MKMTCHAVRLDGKVCGYTWLAKVKAPKSCPQCKSRTWQKPKVAK